MSRRSPPEKPLSTAAKRDSDALYRAALDYHRFPQPGKMRIEPTKRMFGKSGAFPFGGPGMFCRESEMGIASFDAAGGFGGFAFLPRPSFEIFYLVDKGHEISRMIC